MYPMTTGIDILFQNNMSYIITSLLFIISSNLTLFLLLGYGFGRKVDATFLLIFSYGVGPFLLALIFYAAIWLFPGQGDAFYVAITVGLLFLALLKGRGKIREGYEMHEGLILRATKVIKTIPVGIAVIAALFIGLYTIQLVSFPIIDNDSVLYLNQSEAVYEYKNLGWQSLPNIIINGSTFYSYNYTIRSGIPSLMASLYTFLGNWRYTFGSFKFLTLYYYLLLSSLFFYSIKRISKELSFNPRASLSYGLLFFVFSWSITRNYIFSAKETIIYFFALQSLILTVQILRNKNEKWRLPALLGIVLGINSFVNLHGIIIECLILILLLIFSDQSLGKRMAKIFLVLSWSVPFGGLELITGFRYIFSSAKLVAPQVSGNGVVTPVRTLYQTTDVLSDYLRGKLQIFTNVGVLGFYFLSYLVILTKYARRVLRNDFLKVTLGFIVIYYVAIIDPFSVNHYPLSAVLWGSSKYAMLLVFLSMLTTSLFADRFIAWMSMFIKSNSKKLFVAALFLLSVIAIFEVKIIDFGTKFLLLVVTAYKDISFYRNAVGIYLFISMLVLLLFLVALVLFLKKKYVRPIYYFANIFVTFIIIMPFFITNVGKVPLVKSFSFVNKTRKEMLESTLSEGDIFRVFYKAKEILPQGTKLATDFNETFIYNDRSFVLEPIESEDVYRYKIVRGCDDGWEVVYKSGQIRLCKASATPPRDI